MVLLLSACGSREQATLGHFTRALYTPTYATGFSILGPSDTTQIREGESVLIRIPAPWQGERAEEQQLFIVRGEAAIPQGYRGPVLRDAARRIVCMSSSHVAMLDRLGAVERVVGVSGIDFIANPSIREHRDRIADVGYDGNIDYERLIAQRPDLVLLYGITGASAMEHRLRELGIPYLYIGEYMEEDPLGKSEWLVVIAELLGCRERGEELFREIPERYKKLKALAAEARTPRPKVMINTPYADSWFMASATSYVARLIGDAGGEYLYRRNTANHSLPIDIEEAARLTAEADIWLNVGEVQSLQELRERFPKFADVACVQRGEVYNFDKRRHAGGGNDYWESGVMNPDLVLRDLIAIFHPELLPEHEFEYYRKLK